jgi:hypothetical protein
MVTYIVMGLICWFAFVIEDRISINRSSLFRRDGDKANSVLLCFGAACCWPLIIPGILLYLLFGVIPDLIANWYLNR